MDYWLREEVEPRERRIRGRGIKGKGEEGGKWD